ncbi:hypothetical protein F5Y12DRAFT_779763 [Xylaria sp. FL1777]|nr:hypothetical protein F5Y12DRAFT_779763 [Xylaria sp. FL1777]
MMQTMVWGKLQPWAYKHLCVTLVGLKDLLIRARLRRTLFNVQCVLVVETLILYPVRRVSALPIPSEDTATDIAMKSYNLNRTSFITMAVMGTITTAASLVSSAIAIAKLCSRRRHCDSVPRHPANCEDGAEAHAALGQDVRDGSPAADSGEELSLTPEAIAFANPGETDSRKLNNARPSQQVAPMPLERLSRGWATDPSVEDEVV